MLTISFRKQKHMEEKQIRLSLACLSSACCCVLWFVAAATFAGLFGWAYTEKNLYRKCYETFGRLEWEESRLMEEYAFSLSTLGVNLMHYPSATLGHECGNIWENVHVTSIGKRLLSESSNTCHLENLNTSASVTINGTTCSCSCYCVRCESPCPASFTMPYQQCLVPSMSARLT